MSAELYDGSGASGWQGRCNDDSGDRTATSTKSYNYSGFTEAGEATPMEMIRARRGRCAVPNARKEWILEIRIKT